MSPNRRAIALSGLAVLGFGRAGFAQRVTMGSPEAAFRLVTAAAAQVGVTTIYDPAYVRLAFPGGDVPRERGVCTDVVIRAYREAFGLDLQVLVNADMRDNFASYPKLWGLSKPDRNIDHRRVANLRVFLTRQSAALPIPRDASQWASGDIITQELVVPGDPRPGLAHIGIVSDAMAPAGGRRMVIHNIGAGTRVEDSLASYRVTGRYRWLP